jgi:hypothetical protein
MYCELVKILKKGEKIFILLHIHFVDYILTLLTLQTENGNTFEKNDNDIQNLTDIDRHSLLPSLKSSQPPAPPNFSLPSTFKAQI